MWLSAVAIRASVNPYHVPSHHDNHAPLDVLLAVLASLLLIVVMVVPAGIARSRETRRLAEEAPPGTDDTATDDNKATDDTGTVAESGSTTGA